MDEIPFAISTSTPRHANFELFKTARAGGPVTCVCLRSIPPPDRDGDALAQVWALGPYLFRSYCGTKEQALIFPQEVGGTIHGISIRETETFEATSCWDAIVYGGRQLAVCRVLMGLGSERRDSTKMERFNLLHDNKQKSHLTASDWIWDVKILEIGCGADSKTMRGHVSTTSLALGLGRHTVEIWGISSNVSTPISGPADQEFLAASCLQRIPGSPPCLAMSMNLWQQGNTLWITAGTAFQVIQVWSVALGGDVSECEIAHESSLNGHRGVIHSVRWSNEGQSIVSTSDDRSVRLWTRKNDNDAKSIAWDEKWVAWGHTARVWGASFATEAVVSVAEDATTRIWSMETGAELSCIRHSTGLWSISIWDDLAMVGATDGTTTLYNLSQRIPGRQLEVIESILVPDDRLQSQEKVQEVAAEVGPRNKKKKASKIHAQVIVGMLWRNMDEILLATRAGSLMVLNVTNLIWLTYHPWLTPDIAGHGISSSDGCCMALCDDYVAIGTTTGDVVVLRLEDGQTDTRPCHILSGKLLKSVHRLKWFPEYGMLVSFHIRSAAIWKFSDAGLENVTSRTEPSVVLDLETRGSPKSCVFDHKQNQVIMGDMRGNLALFQLPCTLSTCEPSETVKASSVLLRVHKREHVNDISLHGNTIRSVGNDGCISISYRRCTSLQMGFSVPVMSMTGLSQIWSHSGKFDGCVVSGFYGNTYRIVDAVTGREVFEMDTGGRQRLHDMYIPTTELEELGLKHMAVCMNEKLGTNRIAIRRQISRGIDTDGGYSIGMSQGIRVHRETIFDASCFSLGENSHISFVLTASEDCGSRIFSSRDSDLVDVISLTPQESCARAVCTSQFDCTSSLMVVGGGKLKIQFFLAQSTIPGSTPVTSLNEIEVFFLRHGVTRKGVSIDQRVNVVKASPLEGSGLERHHLVVGGDSAGQCFLDIVSEDRCAPASAGVVLQVSDHPILSMALLPILGRVVIVMGNTAGEVLLYDLPGSELNLREVWPTLATTWKPHAAFQAHQMGTNAMSLSGEAVDGTSADVTIFTGGDDQAICICRCRLSISPVDSSLSSGPFSITTEPYASFSALKGIFEVPTTATSGCRYLLTTGYTQRVALWKWENEKLEVVKYLPVDLGDVNALAACRDGKGVLVAVVGLGIELFNIATF